MPQGFEDALNGCIDQTNTDQDYWEDVLVGTSMVSGIRGQGHEDLRLIEQHHDEGVLARVREIVAEKLAVRHGRRKVTPAPERWQTPGRMIET